MGEGIEGVEDVDVEVVFCTQETQGVVVTQACWPPGPRAQDVMVWTSTQELAVGLTKVLRVGRGGEVEALVVVGPVAVMLTTEVVVGEKVVLRVGVG